MYQDWKEVKITGRGGRGRGRGRGRGGVSSRGGSGGGRNIPGSKRYGGANQTGNNYRGNVRRMEDEEGEESMRHQRVPASIARKIRSNRSTKGWSQKELATRLKQNMRVVQDWESGKAMFNKRMLANFERALGTKLR
mmetsp:Transcript_11766/g.12933  ORF Transcript_11766/g.12933 Transcript_11766/m.12933 type:complete len:137 (+) Transcript_11766:40-450(+)|eukprot:CAMPEP_0168519940 /NCGR_PEP_ID=MMETSP0405-20121227/7637_1 /TAXON_ID=498012 /ORGANISM="Trichosphaerium sp, Strain Am-I-7 wt" /LENGTH=136 /DNA_ID=CAMNT_0008540619 /DNA_START=33 /DNA_END=443 /DNA_ORIENTATION=-